MSVCYYESNKNDFFTKRKVNKYKFVNVKMISVYINSYKLEVIMNGILTDFCNADVIGYEKETNKYWCKLFENKCCILHIELEIFEKDTNASFVRFVPLVGNEVLVENFVYNFKESIQLYTTSSFIRTCLDRHIGL